jgi:hypothetical protein
MIRDAWKVQESDFRIWVSVYALNAHTLTSVWVRMYDLNTYREYTHAENSGRRQQPDVSADSG